MESLNRTIDTIDDSLALPDNVEEAVDLIEDLPDHQRRKAVEHLVQKTEIFVGPIPSPSHLMEYEKIGTGFADRIIAMAEKEQNHNIEMNKEAQRLAARDSKMGMIFSLITILSTLLAGTILILNGKSVEGLVSLLVGLGTIVSLFTKSYLEKSKEE